MKCKVKGTPVKEGSTILRSSVCFKYYWEIENHGKEVELVRHDTLKKKMSGLVGDSQRLLRVPAS